MKIDILLFSIIIKTIRNKYDELSIKEICDLYFSLHLNEINAHRGKDYIERLNIQETSS